MKKLSEISSNARTAFYLLVLTRNKGTLDNLRMYARASIFKDVDGLIPFESCFGKLKRDLDIVSGLDELASNDIIRATSSTENVYFTINLDLFTSFLAYYFMIDGDYHGTLDENKWVVYGSIGKRLLEEYKRFLDVQVPLHNSLVKQGRGFLRGSSNAVLGKVVKVSSLYPSEKILRQKFERSAARLCDVSLLERQNVQVGKRVQAFYRLNNAMFSLAPVLGHGDRVMQAWAEIKRLGVEFTSLGMHNWRSSFASPQVKYFEAARDVIWHNMQVTSVTPDPALLSLAARFLTKEALGHDLDAAFKVLENGGIDSLHGNGFILYLKRGMQRKLFRLEKMRVKDEKGDEFDIPIFFEMWGNWGKSDPPSIQVTIAQNKGKAGVKRSLPFFKVSEVYGFLNALFRSSAYLSGLSFHDFSTSTVDLARDFKTESQVFANFDFKDIERKYRVKIYHISEFLARVEVDLSRKKIPNSQILDTVQMGVDVDDQRFQSGVEILGDGIASIMQREIDTTAENSDFKDKFTAFDAKLERLKSMPLIIEKQAKAFEEHIQKSELALKNISEITQAQNLDITQQINDSKDALETFKENMEKHGFLGDIKRELHGIKTEEKISRLSSLVERTLASQQRGFGQMERFINDMVDAQIGTSQTVANLGSEISQNQVVLSTLFSQASEAQRDFSTTLTSVLDDVRASLDAMIDTKKEERTDAQEARKRELIEKDRRYWSEFLIKGDARSLLALEAEISNIDVKNFSEHEIGQIMKALSSRFKEVVVEEREGRFKARKTKKIIFE